MPKVLVVGGGVSGAAFALHLMRDFPKLKAIIEIIEPKALLGAGLAYLTSDPEYRMNGPADCMSPFPDKPLHFDDWFRNEGELDRDPAAALADGRIVSRRAVFGRYMDALVREEAARSETIKLVHVRRSAASVSTLNKGFLVTLDDRTIRDGDVLVLGVGHPAAGLPAPLAGLPQSDRLVPNPWDDKALSSIGSNARVLIVGTGLTACDVIASLAARGHRGSIVALSRRGHFPYSRRVQKLEAFGNFSSPPALTARDLFWRVRVAARSHEAAGGAWEDVILALREQAPVLWRALSHDERLRCLRHLRSIWDSHRYPMAPQISAVIERLEQSGRLRRVAGSIQFIEVAAGSYCVDVRPRGRRENVTEHADVIVNCTGPAHGSLVATNPLIASIAETGLIQGDPYGLGLLVDDRSRAFAASGEPNRSIFALGPLTRGTFGEVIGFPQITLQPRQVAAEVAALLPSAPALEKAAQLPAWPLGSGAEAVSALSSRRRLAYE